MQDTAVVKEITAADNTLDVKSLLQKLYVKCFELDLTSFVASSNKLLSIHSSAEEFDATAEETCVPFQVLGKILCLYRLHVFLSCLQSLYCVLSA